MRYGVDRKRSAHVRLVEAFDKYGVHYYDTTEDILRMKEDKPVKYCWKVRLSNALSSTP